MCPGSNPRPRHPAKRLACGNSPFALGDGRDEVAKVRVERRNAVVVGNAKRHATQALASNAVYRACRRRADNGASRC